MAKKATKAATTFNSQKAKVAAEPQGDHTHLATPAEADKMRKDATKPAAKEAAKTGAKDPIAKFGDPDADPAEMATRRANFG